MTKIGFKMDFSGRNVSVVTPRLALALMRPDPNSFQGVAFGVTSYELPMDPEVRGLILLYLPTHGITA